MIRLSDVFVLGVVVTLILSFTEGFIDNLISRIDPKGMAKNQPPTRRVEIHDIFTLFRK